MFNINNMEQYEQFKKNHPLKKGFTETHHNELIKQIKNKHTEFYIPFLMDLLKHKLQFPIDILDLLVEYNPTLDEFPPEVIKKLIKEIQTEDSLLYTYFQKIKEQNKYVPLLSTLLKDGLWTEQFLNYYLTTEDSSILIELLDSWMSYKIDHRKKIIDTSTNSLFFYLNQLKVEHQRILMERILPHLSLDPSLELMKPCDLDLFRENMFVYTSYLKNISEFLNQLETRIQHRNNQTDLHIRKLFIEQFPFKKSSQFRCVLNQLDKAKYGSRFNTDYYKNLEKNISFLKKFMSIYYDSKDIKIRDAWENVKYDYFQKRKIEIGILPFEEFIHRLPELHQKMILLRSVEELQEYTPELKLDELNQPDDYYDLTPLAYAVLFKNYEAVNYLITTSAVLKHMDIIGKKKIDYDVDIPYTTHGISIIDLAKYVNFKKVVDLLDKKDKTIKRWKSNTIPGFHQTTEDIANIIKESHKNEYWFLAGSTGMYGAGIYFAETAEETNYKALHKGIILQNEVYMGNPLYIKNFNERDNFSATYSGMDSDMIHMALQKRKYDSVIAKREGKKVGQFMRTGTEYIVYNTEQVKFLNIVPEPVQHGGTLMTNTSIIFTTDWILPLQKKDLETLKQLTHTFKKRWILNTTPLMIACANGDISMVQWLLNYSSINDTDFMNRNALYYAIQSGQLTIVQLLLNHNIDVFTKDYNGHYVVDYFNYRDIEKHYEDPMYKIDTSYRSVLLDALYKMGEKANPLIVRFYAKTGRFNDPYEQKRYEVYIQSIYKDVEKPAITYMKIPKTYHVATAAGAKR